VYSIYHRCALWWGMAEQDRPRKGLARRFIVERRRFGRWARHRRFWSKVEIATAAALILMTLTSYVLLTGGSANPSETLTSDRRILTVLLINAGLLVFTAFFVARRVLVLAANRKRGLAGARLHARMTRLFAILAIVPTVVVAAYATLLFDYSSSPWTGKQINLVFANAENVARAYVDETRQRIRAEAVAMGRDIRAPSLNASPRELGDFVQAQTALRNLSEAYIFRKSPGETVPLVLAASDFWSTVKPDAALKPEEASARIAETKAGEVIFWSGPNDARPDILRAVLQINKSPDLYLIVGRQISADVFQQADTTRRALQDYQSWNQRRKILQRQFTIVLAVLSLLILLAAVWAALYSADTMIAPIGRLVRAAERVARGDLGARVSVRGEPDDLGVLAKSFNRMTSQLQMQTGALMTANEQLDVRRRFTEAVLSGVSAGVLGLDRNGYITLPNRSAATLLEMNSEWLTGQPLFVAIPEATQLLAEVQLSPLKTAAGLVTINRDSGQKMLMMQISTDLQDGVAQGYVVTFDDVTEAIANQRRAAWSDVARRIAHEIKNPLTPIQLSAERLKRKYLKEVQTDPDVFLACTDTIIRNVNELRRMVDEFSSFARMPKPVFQHENLVEIVRRAIFQLELSAPSIAISFVVPPKPVFLFCDGRQIAQALTNILKNATEAIQPRLDAGDVFDPEICIDLVSDDGTVKLSVADNGIGIPADIKEKLTEPYVTTRVKGTGLGLAIVKKIIEDHFGQLLIENRTTGGARMCMVFNTEKAAAYQEQLQADAAETNASTIARLVPSLSEKKHSYGA
jgi:two-component system, NtrC family, nitrogen regulation sensor histidine kinase NtrY